MYVEGAQEYSLLRLCAYIHTFIHIYINIYMPATHTHTHKQIHTHTQARGSRKKVYDWLPHTD